MSSTDPLSTALELCGFYCCEVRPLSFQVVVVSL